MINETCRQCLESKQNGSVINCSACSVKKKRNFLKKRATNYLQEENNKIDE